MASKFQKRHYEAIAQALQAAHPLKGSPADNDLENFRWFVCRNEIARMLERDNSDFKRGRFEAACEPGANVRARG